MEACLAEACLEGSNGSHQMEKHRNYPPTLVEMVPLLAGMQCFWKYCE
jgi:hypothetical protein